MTPILTQQRALLAAKLVVLQRLHSGLAWSLDQLPALGPDNITTPAVAERIAAIVDRFCKLQDQLAGSMRHAHAMLGERQRNFHDVVRWAVSEAILPDETTWLELRGLRNRLTHEYDPASDSMVELVALIRHDAPILAAVVDGFARLCAQRNLVVPA